MTQEEIQATLLKILKSGPIRLGGLVPPATNNNLRNVVRNRTGIDFEIEWYAVNEAVWGLVVRRLASIATYKGHPNNWYIQLTERGKAAAESEAVNPDDPLGYMSRLLQTAPASAMKIVRPRESTAETQPQLQPASPRLSALNRKL
jgi:hypothetical protein